ncbi:MAG: hypothetical protein WCX31_18300 [Salinivirgaceae bacterium]|jgi:hypothetical protein
MKAKIVFWGILLSLGLYGCKKENENRIMTDKFSIAYLRGSSWVDYSYEVIMENNGKMQVIEDHGISNLHRQSNYTIKHADIDLIKENLADLSLININNSYGFGENAPKDLPVVLIKYKTDYNSDSTVIYSPDKDELPKELVSFLSTIGKLISDIDMQKK